MMFQQTKALCDVFLKAGIPALDLIVYKDGQCILRHLGGAAKGTEKYHIYSCSKLFTCVAAMQLWEKGLFSLEDKLSDYIPEFQDMLVKTQKGLVPAKNPIRIHHLFEMTSGMNYDLEAPAILSYRKESGGRCPTVETVKLLAKTPLEFEPGESWLYSLSHDVLAALVEILSGEKFEDYVKKHIFDPLGMENSDFLHNIEDWDGFADQYLYENGVYQPIRNNIYRFGTEYASGGAGCVSTVEDYIKFLEALRIGDGILKKETISLMATDRLTAQQRKAYTYGTESTGYGLGMRTPREGGQYREFGWGGAAGAFAAVDVENGITIYYAQHVRHSPIQSIRKYLYRTVIADLKGETITLPIPENLTGNQYTY